MSTNEPLEGGSRPATRRMTKPFVILFLAAALVLGGIFGWKAFIGSMIKKFMAANANVAQTVSTVHAGMSLWQPQFQAVGTLRAVRGADLSAQIDGMVGEIAFDSGNDVPAGKVLLRLRPNDDYAKLQQLEAAAELADQTLKRDKEQFAVEAVSQATIDTDTATLKSARAQVAAQQALIEEKIVKAPFAGRLGIRQVDLGQYLTAGTTVVTLQALDPILLDFYLPQQALRQLKAGQAAVATVDTYPGVRFSGVIEAINAKVDTASRNVQVRATFRNPDKRLLPGMFASVAIDSAQATRQITVPQSCITYNPYGNTVYVVEHATGADGKAKLTVVQRFVTLGATRGDQVAVQSGLAEGEEVVSAGQMKLRNGSAIEINNKIQPANDANPSPPNE